MSAISPSSSVLKVGEFCGRFGWSVGRRSCLAPDCMKYLEYSVLEEVNSALSCVDTCETRVFARLDAYSCKNTNDDKKLKHHIDEKYTSDAMHADVDMLVLMPIGSPTLPGSFASASSSFQLGGGLGNFTLGPPVGLGVSPSSPYGPLAQVTSRKTLFYLLATLNSAFPDYDFSDVKPELFMKVPMLKIVQESVKSTLFGMGLEGLSHNISDRLWEAIDEVIQLIDCDMYSFNPDPEMEPDSEEGNLWSFYYFFFNKKLKRVVFFTARAVSYMAPIQPEEMTTDIYGDTSDQPMFDSEMGLSYEQYTMESMEV
ncbi:RNA polymerase III-inhibiting protein maf1 [Chytriomyces hyalinus]|nr:RNA polymerase III-inhibiting protein maf1 [Chytriomyces hyalinus]